MPCESVLLHRELGRIPFFHGLAIVSIVNCEFCPKFRCNAIDEEPFLPAEIQDLRDMG